MHEMRGTIYRRLAVVTMIVSLLLVGCGKVQEPSNEIDELHSLEETEPTGGEEDAPLTQTDRNKLSHKISFMGLSQALIPTGCEAVSAVAILNHLGIEITPESFIEEFLPKQDFYQVLDILLDNATKYGDKKISILLDKNGFAITNDGAIISKNDLEKVFDRFYQTDKSKDGSGLGLAIAKELCRQNGWKIICESQNRHTRFVVKFNK